MNPTAFAIMAKAPAPQGVKTRLAPVLGPSQRRALAVALLQDRVDQLNRLADADAFVAFTPDDARAELERMLEGKAELVAQRGDGLGERLHNASVALLSRGHQRVLLVDADSALVPDASFVEAAAALSHADVVLGPSEDGGYYLIGLRAAHEQLFRGITYSTSTVLAHTVERARDAELSVHLLPSSYDVDEPSDLHRLAADLVGSASGPEWPRRTARLVAELVAGLPPVQEEP